LSHDYPNDSVEERRRVDYSYVSVRDPGLAAEQKAEAGCRSGAAPMEPSEDEETA
jgi:hypothetical protein